MIKVTARRLACILLPATAYAQQPPADSVIALPAIEVLASLSPSAGPPVGAGVAGNVVRITNQHLRAWHPRTATEALQSSAATFYDDLGSPLKQSAVLRGFTVGPIVGMPQGVSVFLDGVPMNELGSGDVAFDLLPLEHIERIEVLSGTASLLGPNTLGGAINFITRRGGQRDVAIGASAGSHEQFGVDAHVEGGAPLGWASYVGGGHQTEGGWRESMQAERTHLFATWGKFGDRSGLRFQLLGARSHAQTAGSLPASIYQVKPDSNLTAGDFELLRQVQLAASGYTTVASGLASARVFLRANDAERFNVNQAADPDIRGFSDSRTAGVELDWRGVRNLGASRLFLRAGTGGTLNRTSVELFAERIEAGQTTHVRSPIQRLDAFGVFDWKVSDVIVSGGARVDVVRVPFRNLLNPARDTTSTFTNLSPRGSVTWQVGGNVATYASIGRGFRAPALIEIACADPEEPCPLPFALGDDPPIAAVRVLTYEAGVNYSSGRLSVNGVVYRSNVRDDIFLFPYEDESEPSGSTIDGYFGNVPRTRREGMEVGVRAQPTAGVGVYANYSATRATFQTDDLEIFSIREAAGEENAVSKGDHFPLVPAFTLQAGVDAALRDWRFGVAANVVGKRYLRGDEANDEPPLPWYGTADARLGYQAGEWAIGMRIRNLTGARYTTFGGFNINQGAGDVLERFLTPGQPRRFEVFLQRG